MVSTKICLATEVVIDFLKGDENTIQKIKLYSNEELFITVFTLFELRSLIKKKEVVSEFLNYVSVLPFDERASEIAVKILLDDKIHHIERNNYYIFNAAICIANDVLLFTKERAYYEGIKLLKFV